MRPIDIRRPVGQGTGYEVRGKARNSEEVGLHPRGGCQPERHEWPEGLEWDHLNPNVFEGPLPAVE
jgi:hypothetical protein